MKRFLLLVTLTVGLATACQRTEVEPEIAICPPPAACIDPTKIDTKAVCTEQYEPVCGCDAKTYANPCRAASAGVQFFSKGPCPTKAN